MGFKEFRGIFTDKHDGLVPASGGNPNHYLNAAGGWTMPIGQAPTPDGELDFGNPVQSGLLVPLFEDI